MTKAKKGKLKNAVAYEGRLPAYNCVKTKFCFLYEATLISIKAFTARETEKKAT